MTRILALTLLAATLPVAAQKKLEIDHDKSCCYTGHLDPKIDLYTFDSDDEATNAVKRIMAYSGLEPNFIVAAANVGNAAAVIDGDQRLNDQRPQQIETGAGHQPQLIGDHLQ